MPGFLLHVDAMVTCPHGGKAEPAAPQPRVKVSKKAITTMPNPYRVTGCAAQTQCVTALWQTAALRVKSMGAPVLLNDSQGQTNVMAPLQILVTQTRVKAT